jgi:mitochondrial cardiolipin hydrolase
MKNLKALITLTILVFMINFKAVGKTTVLFSPDDKPTTTLIKIINETKLRIYAAIYMITDKDVANALIKAKNERFVDVQIITDRTSMESIYGKGTLLEKSGINVLVFSSLRKQHFKTTDVKNPYSIYAPLMHNKFALFDDKVWTGSFNWTKSANRKNRENVIITDDLDVYKKYEQHFEKLKTECTCPKLICPGATEKQK